MPTFDWNRLAASAFAPALLIALILGAMLFHQHESVERVADRDRAAQMRLVGSLLDANLDQAAKFSLALAEPFAMSLPAISKHLKVLEGAGLIRRTVDGRIHHCRLAPEPLDDATDWIREHRDLWQRQFNQLARYLEQTSGVTPDNNEENT